MATRVLIVDDSAFMRKRLKEAVAELDCEVVGEAADGEDALAKYRELSPDVVTLDLIMPKKGGLEALQDIRKLDPEAKVIVITAVEQRKSLIEALACGAIDYVVKPFEEDRVADALRRATAQ